MHERRKQITTTASRPRRLLFCLLVVATLATAPYATTASAAATPTPIYTQTTVVGAAPDPQPCTGVVGGTITVTITEQGHMVTGADGTFHEFLTVTFDAREDWTDGTYLIDHSVAPQDFNINATGTNSFTGAQQDRGTLYSPTGQIIGYSVIATEFHGTVVNGTPLPPHDQFRIISSPC
jgi:hypothetical protein